MHWPGHGCGGGEPGQSWSAESVISVWTHLGGHCLRRLSWGVSRVVPCSRLLPSPPGSSSQKACTPCGLASLCLTCGCSCAGGGNRRQDRVGSQKVEPSVDSHRFPPRVVLMRWPGNGWDGGGRGQSLFTKSVNSVSVNSPSRPLLVAMGLWRFPCVVPCARILPCPQGLTSRST